MVRSLGEALESTSTRGVMPTRVMVNTMMLGANKRLSVSRIEGNKLFIVFPRLVVMGFCLTNLVLPSRERWLKKHYRLQ